jgi:LPPG:FO 2-phospho-L-lactate transferase
VGAARLLRGLAEVVDPNGLTVVVNTGDDDEFYGLHVSPDVDTILYTLAGMAPIARGWGIRGDTFRAKAALDRLAGTGWFQIGDRDLATHVHRTQRLRRGETLSACTNQIARALGVRTRVLPVTDDPVRTMIATGSGLLSFQEYLVKHRGRPRVERVVYRGARKARPAPGVLAAIEHADIVLVAPSNPFVSIGPMLAVPGVRKALRSAASRTVAVSPLIGGRAIKGPLASMLRSMGHGTDAAALARLYAGLARVLVVAPGDAPTGVARSRWPLHWPQPVEHDILITRLPAARRLARFALELAAD